MIQGIRPALLSSDRSHKQKIRQHEIQAEEFCLWKIGASPSRTNTKQQQNMNKGEFHMKRTFTALVALALLATLVPALYADDDDHDKCNNATLKGGYSFTISGWYVTVDPSGLLDLPQSTLVNVTGVDKFDGKGNLTSSWNYCFNGTCAKQTDVVSTYTINPDCSGTLLIGGRTPFNAAVANNGQTVYVQETDAGSNLSGTITKQ